MNKTMRQMEFRTVVDVPPFPFRIDPCERMLFVGSCFAEEMGRRFAQAQFRVTANPFGVMYNPASILHTVQRLLPGERAFSTVVLTLGTNHVYVLKETGEIVDNCRKRPQYLFDERQLGMDECAEYLSQTISLLQEANPDVKVILTVSPIRYRKYGYHGSQLSKAVLLLAVQELLRRTSQPSICYFPSYEIIIDELRDYRFYQSDMLHPSDQAIDYIYQRFAEVCFSERTWRFLKEWEPIQAALAHRPFDASSPEYQSFMEKTRLRIDCLSQQFPTWEPSDAGLEKVEN